jgi:hypothetical protein
MAASDTEHGPNGTAILVQMRDVDDQKWHHSVAFDGYDTHTTACGMHVYIGRVNDVEMDPIETWSELKGSASRCPACHNSVQSLLADSKQEADF